MKVRAVARLIAWGGTCESCGAGLGPGAPRGGTPIAIMCPLCGGETSVLAEIEVRLLTVIPTEAEVLD